MQQPEGEPAGTRNLLSHLTWRPQALKAAHYAAFPRFIPRLAIQAGTSERGVCPTCGAPWLRVIASHIEFLRGRHNRTKHRAGDPADDRAAGIALRAPVPGNRISTTPGWRQSCRCAPHEPAPATVLDCFGGSGTTGIEANALGRHAVLVELQERYVQIAHKRLSGQPLSLFAHEGAAEFAGAEVDALETTKQEQYPNRTVRGLQPAVEARDGAVGVAPEAAG